MATPVRSPAHIGVRLADAGCASRRPFKPDVPKDVEQKRRARAAAMISDLNARATVVVMHGLRSWPIRYRAPATPRQRHGSRASPPWPAPAYRLPLTAYRLPP